MKEAPAAQNAVSLNSKEFTNHDSDGPNKQIRTALGKATTPAPSLIDGAEDEREALVALAALGEAEARLRAELEDKLAELRRKYEERIRRVTSQPATFG